MTQVSGEWMKPTGSATLKRPSEHVASSRGVRAKEISDLVIVANRLPIQATSSDGDHGWQQSPGGLVTALSSALTRSQRNLWVGWSGLSEPVIVPDSLNEISLRGVEMSASEVAGHYEGFSNGCLWPLYHDSIEQPGFHRTWWDAYRSVNKRFADVVAVEAPPASIVWIHDYHLQLVPSLLRELRPDLRIGFFLHTPFPAPELFHRLPWRSQIVHGILGADVVGFQTRSATRNFRSVAVGLIGARPDGRRLRVDGRAVLVDTFPIGIDPAPISNAAGSPQVHDRIEQLRAVLGGPRQVLLGADRLDYTKGIQLRLKAIRELLDEQRLDPSNTAVVQIAEPSRDGTRGYARIRQEVEQLAGGINGDYSRLGAPLVHYMHRSVDQAELVALFRMADVMLVTPFADGMNLVAKEFVAARTDLRGTLVLSEFAGAAVELGDALLVNPYDIESVKSTIVAALQMPAAEQERRMSSMRAVVNHATVERWATRFLSRLA